jgi:hypothetical protein
MFGGGDGEMKNDCIRRKPVGKHDFSDHDHGPTNLGKDCVGGGGAATNPIADQHVHVPVLAVYHSSPNFVAMSTLLQVQVQKNRVTRTDGLLQTTHSRM